MTPEQFQIAIQFAEDTERLASIAWELSQKEPSEEILMELAHAAHKMETVYGELLTIGDEELEMQALLVQNVLHYPIRGAGAHITTLHHAAMSLIEQKDNSELKAAVENAFKFQGETKRWIETLRRIARTIRDNLQQAS